MKEPGATLPADDVTKGAGPPRLCGRQLEVTWRRVLLALQLGAVLVIAAEALVYADLRVQDVLRRGAAVALCSFVSLDIHTAFHACVVVVSAQLFRAMDAHSVAPPLFVGAAAVTLHRCAMHSNRT